MSERRGRNETEAERLDRNLLELLQELRVAGIGVQVLFAFLLTLPFTSRFDELSDTLRTLYIVDLLLAALAIALLSSPVAFHRLVFHRHSKKRLLRFANVAAIAGLVTVALAISGAVVLIVSFVEHGPVVPIISGVTIGVLFGLWFLVPLLARGQDDY